MSEWIKKEDVEQEQKPEYTFDLSKIEPATITDLHQEGNYLVGTTNTGTIFRQRIPQGKILNKVKDKYILQDMAIQ